MCQQQWMVASVLLGFMWAGPASQATLVGTTAADFTLPEWYSRKPMSLHGFDGKIVLLDFFLSYCGHCQTSASELQPHIQEYYAARGGNPAGIPVQLIAINIDANDPAKTTAFLQQYGLGLALDDAGRSVYNHYLLTRAPVCVLINGVAGTNYGKWEILYHSSEYVSGEYNLIRPLIDAIATPEPTAIALAALGSVAFLRRRRA